MPQHCEQMFNSFCGPEVMDAKVLIAQRTPDNSLRHFVANSRGRKASDEERAHDCLALFFRQASSHHWMFDCLRNGVDLPGVRMRQVASLDLGLPKDRCLQETGFFVLP